MLIPCLGLTSTVPMLVRELAHSSTGEDTLIETGMMICTSYSGLGENSSMGAPVRLEIASRIGPPMFLWFHSSATVGLEISHEGSY